MELHERVKKRRLELGLTQEELAKRMGYSSRVSVNKIEMGRPISQKIISKLANALNVKESYLMGWEEDNNNNIDEQFTDKEKEIIELFRHYNEENKNTFFYMAKTLAESQIYRTMANKNNNISLQDLIKLMEIKDE